MPDSLGGPGVEPVTPGAKIQRLQTEEGRSRIERRVSALLFADILHPKAAVIE